MLKEVEDSSPDQTHQKPSPVDQAHREPSSVVGNR